MAMAQHPHTCSRKKDTASPPTGVDLALLRRLARKALCWITVVSLPSTNPGYSWIHLVSGGCTQTSGRRCVRARRINGMRYSGPTPDAEGHAGSSNQRAGRGALNGIMWTVTPIVTH
jgi:hypothetical protein